MKTSLITSAIALAAIIVAGALSSCVTTTTTAPDGTVTKITAPDAASIAAANQALETVTRDRSGK